MERALIKKLKQYNLTYIIIDDEYILFNVYMLFCKNIINKNIFPPLSIELYYSGSYYHFVKYDYDKAIEYYKKAINSKNIYAMLNLAYYYKNIEHNHLLTLKYYKMASEHGSGTALNYMGYYYYNMNKHKKALTYFKKGIKNGNITSMKNLVYFYQKTHKHKKAQKYYNIFEHCTNTNNNIDTMIICAFIY